MAQVSKKGLTNQHHQNNKGSGAGGGFGGGPYGGGNGGGIGGGNGGPSSKPDKGTAGTRLPCKRFLTGTCGYKGHWCKWGSHGPVSYAQCQLVNENEKLGLSEAQLRAKASA